MTSRQARRERREEERKARKAAYKAQRHAAAASAPSPVELPIEEEFSPELIAEARAVRQRIQQRADINRANSLHSTGPQSPAGKLASSRNSLKHGLASGTLIIPGEDRAAFESLLESLLADHQPANTTEEMLVHELAQSWWLAQRALRLQNECFTENGIDEKRLALFLRYHTTHHRAFHKALAALIRLQKDRARSQRPHTSGFVSHASHSQPEDPGFVSQNHAPSSPIPPPLESVLSSVSLTS